jgi:DNA polymerase elongation subunit (family B)
MYFEPMLAHIDIEQILFLDIETVPAVYQYGDLDEKTRELWSLKTRYIQSRDNLSPDEVYKKAGIYAEFGKVVCISTAICHADSDGMALRVKSFYGDDEGALLDGFATMLSKHFTGSDKYLCGHNVKEFDVPFMARRMVLNGLDLPHIINVPGKKPWEVNFIDTMELWKFGDYKHFTSLNLLTHLFGIPTPKDDISGADVSRVYWEEKDLERIKTYCEKDTIAVAQLMRKFKNQPLIDESKIKII